MRNFWLRLVVATLVVVPFLAWVAAPADAAPAGLLDPTWGSGGMLTAHLDSLQHFCQVGQFGSVPCGPMEGVSSLDAHDGRVYLASPFLGPTDPLQQVAVVAFTPSGAPDPSFGTRGVVLFNATTSSDDMSLSRVMVQPGPGATEYLGWDDSAGGRILRLEPDGSLDPTFGNHGVVALPTGSGTTTFDWLPMRSSPDGSLTVAFNVLRAAENPISDGLIRLRPDGTPDAGYGTGGMAVFPYPPIEALTPVSLAVGADGRAFEMLGPPNGQGPGSAVVAVTSTGQVDTSFGDHGVVEPFAGGRLAAIAVDSAERVLVMGSIALPGGTNMLAITRLGGDGSADPTFGNHGTFGLGFAGLQLQPSQLTLDASGRALATFEDFNGHSTPAGMVRLTSSGQLDHTFGPTTSPGVNQWLTLPALDAITIGADGTIYAGGSENGNARLDPIDLHLIAVVGNP
jgi:uncharacterized delta-60 repeat protein